MSTPEDIVRRLNSEDCENAIGLCLREYKEKDCWLCILKEYTNEIYNQAIKDFVSKLRHFAYNYYAEDGYVKLDDIYKAQEEMKR